MWHVTGYVMLSAAVAAGVSVVVAAVVLPTLATDQVRGQGGGSLRTVTLTGHFIAVANKLQK